MSLSFLLPTLNLNPIPEHYRNPPKVKLTFGIQNAVKSTDGRLSVSFVRERYFIECNLCKENIKPNATKNEIICNYIHMYIVHYTSTVVHIATLWLTGNDGDACIIANKVLQLTPQRHVQGRNNKLLKA